jgi:hypothetical protein
MARKTVGKKNLPKKPKKRTLKKISLKIHLLKTFTWLCVLLILVVAAGFCVHYLLLRKPNVKQSFATEIIKSSEPAPQKEQSQKDKNEAVSGNNILPSETEIKTAKISPPINQRLMRFFLKRIYHLHRLLRQYLQRLQPYLQTSCPNTFKGATKGCHHH